ncbi:MAG: transcription termination/antitermination protein NusA [Deltaproteobacteria bacterium]|nr:transcription termination/antitermination protein NusA [Candidatus Zymogenaceae bacterium]
MYSNLNHVLEQVEKEKGIDKQVLIEAIESAMLTAANKKFGNQREIEASFNEELGEVELFEFKEVVEEVTDPMTEISLEDAVQSDPEAVLGDVLGFKLDISDFGRIAAQTAKQVIIQKVRNAERENIYEEYKDRVNELITGMVQRFERGNIYVNLGRAEAIIPSKEQVPREGYRQGDRIRAYILDVLRESKGPQIIMSRTHPGLLVKLFELEVPEISEGIVKIMGAAREPGERSKIAVYSTDRDVDPVGACVGIKGSRVQSIVQELRGEKIDIVPWDEDTVKFVCNALSPAEVTEVIFEEDVREMEIIVADDQLSLAIGKKGQNVRLASKLVGWKLDIKSASKKEKQFAEVIYALGAIPGVGIATAQILYEAGIMSVSDVVESGPEFLSSIPSLGQKKAESIYAVALDIVEGREPVRSVEDIEETDTDTAEAEAPAPSGGAASVDEPTESVESSLKDLDGVGDKMLETLIQAGFDTIEKIAQSDAETLSDLPGIGQKKAEALIESARARGDKDM